MHRVRPLGAAAWRKSSHSGNTGGDCIEVAAQPCRIAVRDSKNPDGPAYTVTPAAFTAFVTAAVEGGVRAPGRPTNDGDPHPWQ
ncbi:DUF397 domain-containing protein [Streptomyces sp. NBC_00829]|uniref:DUF397 domain-containing protein n=1 Tax=Streptomyces sp. NBC_00829 TaxID=2903679 RepID=UPI003862F100